MKYKVETCLSLHSCCCINFRLIYPFVCACFSFGARKKIGETVYKKKRVFPLSLGRPPLDPAGPRPPPLPARPKPRPSSSQRATASIPPAAADQGAPPVRVAPYLQPKRIWRNDRLRFPRRAQSKDPRSAPAYLKVAAPVRAPPPKKP